MLDAIGTAYGARGNYAQAAVYFKQSIKLAESIDNKEGIALSTGNLGITHLALGDNEKSLEYSQKNLALAEQIGDRERILESLNNIAKTLNKTGNLAEALTAVERAVGIAQQIKQSERLSEANGTADKIYSSLKRFDNARHYFDQAITILERLRSRVAGEEQSKSLFLSDKVTPYHQMIDLLQREGRASETFSYAEKAKERVLLSILRGTKSEIMKLMTSAEKEENRRLKKGVIKAEALRRAQLKLLKNEKYSLLVLLGCFQRYRFGELVRPITFRRERIRFSNMRAFFE